MMIDERPEVFKVNRSSPPRLTGPDAVVYLGQRTMDKHPVELGIEGVLKTYELLDRVRTRQDLTIRDDQFEFAVFLDAAAYARRKRIPMTVLDTGRFAAAELESLARRSVRICTSDEARPRPEELEILVRACRASRSSLAFLLEAEIPAGDESTPFSGRVLEDLMASGMDLHVSNRTLGRDPGALEALAATGRKGRALLVYYHHGPVGPELIGPASRGAWIHFSDRGIEDGDSAGAACAVARAAAAAGSRAVVTVERPATTGILESLWAAGAALRFLTPPGEAGSTLAAMERKAGRRKIPPRAVYLSDILFP